MRPSNVSSTARVDVAGGSVVSPARPRASSTAPASDAGCGWSIRRRAGSHEVIMLAGGRPSDEVENDHPSVNWAAELVT